MVLNVQYLNAKSAVGGNVPSCVSREGRVIEGSEQWSFEIKKVDFPGHIFYRALTQTTHSQKHKTGTWALSKNEFRNAFLC